MTADRHFSRIVSISAAAMVLRPGKTTRLVFKPQIVNNKQDRVSHKLFTVIMFCTALPSDFSLTAEMILSRMRLLETSPLTTMCPFIFIAKPAGALISFSVISPFKKMLRLRTCESIFPDRARLILLATVMACWDCIGLHLFVDGWIRQPVTLLFKPDTVKVVSVYLFVPFVRSRPPASAKVVSPIFRSTLLAIS